ncbi:hypothetical protein DL93DRAFT_2201266 [Clavulina sp. PMI_390]|nr:hypothetical protein DL93DRAFT_2201266 [Clavulina sp. PMI_390]
MAFFRPQPAFTKAYAFSSHDYQNTTITCAETNEIYWIEGQPSPYGVYTLSKPAPNGQGGSGPDSRMIVATIELPLPSVRSETRDEYITYNGVRSNLWGLFPQPTQKGWLSRLIPTPFGDPVRWIKAKRLVDTDGQILALYERNQRWFSKSSGGTLKLSPEASNLNIEMIILGWALARWDVERWNQYCSELD